MARRRWRTAPAMFVENRETGDGRVFAPGALSWDPALPQPFAWMRDGDQHVDLSEVAPQIGVVDSATITRDGDLITAEGWIDDEIPDGAELVRRLEAGTASHGNRQGVSIDPDNWAVELIVKDDGEDGGIVMLASGSGRFPTMADLRSRFAPRARELVTVAAAAGDPDPGPGGGDGGVVLFEDASDMMVARFTRARFRGLTAVSVPALDMALIELAPDAEPVVEEEPVEEVEPDEVAASAAVDVDGVAHDRLLRPVRASATRTRSAPPAEWFDLPEPALGASGMVDLYGMPVQELIVEQPDGQYGVPLTIVERPDLGLHQVFGNVALWGTCHTGYLPECVTPPDSPSAYAHFHVGEVRCADGERRATGPLTVGTDHAAARLLAQDARDHYANTGLAFADVRASSGAFGPWVAGVCRPLTDEQLAVVRASSLSGDWRRIGGALEMVGALAVNVPGFPIGRDAVVAAALSLLASAGAPTVGWDDGEIVSLVAAGIVQRCPDCAQRARTAADPFQTQVLDRLDGLASRMDALERRTRHLNRDAAAELMSRIGNGKR